MKKTTTPCTVEIANTSRDFYAHVALEDNSIRPGDQVLVHNPPTEIRWGEQLRVEREATISRASWFARWWTKWVARFELTTLYEVRTGNPFGKGKSHEYTCPSLSRQND